MRLGSARGVSRLSAEGLQCGLRASVPTKAAHVMEVPTRPQRLALRRYGRDASGCAVHAPSVASPPLPAKQLVLVAIGQQRYHLP